MLKNLMRNRLSDAGNRFRFIDAISIAMWAERPRLRKECVSSDPVTQRARRNGELLRHANTLEPVDHRPQDPDVPRVGLAGGTCV